MKRIQRGSGIVRRIVHTSYARDRFLARKIGDMDEGVVERGVGVSDTENELALSNLGAE